MSEKELKDDLTVKTIKDFFGNDISSLHINLQQGVITKIDPLGYENEKDIPASWLKPKVKKWIPKKVRELEAGDVMTFNGAALPIEDLNPCYHPENKPRMQVKIKGYIDYIYRHMDEFVTVEVEE